MSKEQFITYQSTSLAPHFLFYLNVSLSLLKSLVNLSLSFSLTCYLMFSLNPRSLSFSLLKSSSTILSLERIPTLHQSITKWPGITCTYSLVLWKRKGKLKSVTPPSYNICLCGDLLTINHQDYRRTCPKRQRNKRLGRTGDLFNCPLQLLLWASRVLMKPFPCVKLSKCMHPQ